MLLQEPDDGLLLALNLNPANFEVSVDLKASLVAFFVRISLFVSFHLLDLRLLLLELGDKRLNVVLDDCSLNEWAEGEQFADLLARA